MLRLREMLDAVRTLGEASSGVHGRLQRLLGEASAEVCAVRLERLAGGLRVASWRSARSGADDDDDVGVEVWPEVSWTRPGAGAGTPAEEEEEETWPAVEPAAAGGDLYVCEERWFADREVARRLEEVLRDAPRVEGTAPAAWVYHLPTVRARASRLCAALGSAVQQWYFAMKANDNEAVLRTMVESGFGLECVSAGEVALAKRVCPAAPLLFTPNFAAPSETLCALRAGAEVVLDSAAAVRALGALDALGLEAAARFGVRIDPASLPGWGFHHGQRAGGAAHVKVETAGAEQKFGCDVADLADVAAAIERVGGRLVGLHVHAGSGARDPDFWASIARQVALAARRLGDDQRARIEWVDLGGGLAVSYRPADAPVDLAAVATAVLAARSALDDAGLAHVQLRMEPGRFCVAPSGVLLTQVTAVKRKQGVTFVGISAGMNALLRPALYDAFHSVVALRSLLHAALPTPALAPAVVVGPICESADVVNRTALLPRDISPADPVLVLNAGAYGHVMSSNYNARGFLPQICFE